MRTITGIYLEKLIDAQLIPGTNHEVYDRRLLDNLPKYDKSPHCIYFYYIKFEPGGCPAISHYYYDHGTDYIPYADMPAHIKRLAENARAGGNNPPQNGQDFEGIEWRRKSYIAIFMDSPCWQAWKRNSYDDKCGILFNLLKGSTPNHSFFDADDIEVDMAAPGDPSEIRSAIYFVNHMKKNSDGDDLLYKADGMTPDTQYFAFDVYFDVRHGNRTSSTVFVIDPDGTNVGPPVPPPA